MKPAKLTTILTLIPPLVSCAAVRTGLDNVADYSALLEGKRIGVITNHTAYNSDGEYIVDVLGRINGAKVTALFGPEHGIRGSQAAGKRIESQAGPAQEVPVYSLYGKTRKPTSEMLKNVDILVFDIQDVGARFYTYIYTMALTMEAAAENRKGFVVLDRPNPINGLVVECGLDAFASRHSVGFEYPVRDHRLLGPTGLSDTHTLGGFQATDKLPRARPRRRTPVSGCLTTRAGETTIHRLSSCRDPIAEQFPPKKMPGLLAHLMHNHRAEDAGRWVFGPPTDP